MGKSADAKQRVTDYRMSIHLGIGHTLDGITKIEIDEKVAWSGNVTTNTTLSITEPNLYGGQQKEGGFIGNVDVLLGGPTQVLPAPVAARYGRAPIDCPAFRGLTTLFFRSNGVYSTGRNGQWVQSGNVDAPDGALWKVNSPIIAQKIDITGYRISRTLPLATAHHPLTYDANPVHIIHEIMVNREWGMGGLPALIDLAGFSAAAQRIFDEGLFLSFWWMRQSTCEDLVREVLDHIQATLFLNPNTGLVSIKLLREDYDLADLRRITPTNAALSNFKRRSSGEIVNEMTVQWTNPINEQLESITAQDDASIQSQGGEKVSGSRNYYGVRDKAVATKLLERDLRASTAPLISADATLDRSAWDLLPGEVVILDWPKRSAFSAIMRVGKVGYGKPLDSKIKVSLLQDVFSLEQAPIRILPDTTWPDPRNDPAPLTQQLFTVPAFFTRNSEIQSVSVDLDDGEALVGSLADSLTIDSLDYELVSETVTANGDAIFTSKGAMSMASRALLASALPAAATSTLPAALFPLADEAPRVGGFVLLGYGDTNQEFTLVTAQTGGGWTVARGSLDTVPRDWSIGTPAWVVNPGSKLVDTQTIHGEGTTATYRGLDRTALGLLPIADAPPVSLTVTNRAHLPLRPANVTVEGAAFGSVALLGTDVTVQWSKRNRLLEDSQVLRWTDGPVASEFRQETVVQLRQTTGQLIAEYGGFWEQGNFTFPSSWLDRYAAVDVKVIARREGQDSLQGHTIRLTGLPNNPAGNTPGAGPAREPAPSKIPEPGAFVYDLVGNGRISNADGTTTPAIEVLGIEDNFKADQLVVLFRTQRPGDSGLGEPVIVFGELTRSAPFTLNRDLQTFVVQQGVIATEIHDVWVAYVVGGVLSRARYLGQVDTRVVAPPAPTGLNAEAVLLAADAVGVQQSIVRATWNAVPPNAAPDLAGYDTEFVEDGSPAVTRTTVNTFDKWQQAVPGVNYAVRIRSRSKSGAVSVWTEPMLLVGAGDPALPLPQILVDRINQAVAAGGGGGGGGDATQAIAEAEVRVNAARAAADLVLSGNIVSEALARAQAIIGEANARSAAIAAEAAARVAEIAAERVARGEDIAEVTEDVDIIRTDLSAEVIVRETQISAVEGSIALVESTARTYTDDQLAEASLNFVTTAAFGSGLSTTLSSANSYADGVRTYADQTFATTSALNTGLANTLIAARTYTDDLESRSSLLFVTNASLDASEAATLIAANSYADGVRAYADLTFATTSALNNGLSGTLIAARTYTDEFEARANLTFATAAALGSSNAATLQQANSYADGVKAYADLTFATVAALGTATAGTLISANSYADGIKAYADQTFVTTAVLGSANAATLQLAKSYVDDELAQASLDFATKAERSSGDASTLLSARSYTDDLESRANATFAAQSTLNGVSANASLALSTAVTANGRASATIGLTTTVGNVITGLTSVNTGLTSGIKLQSDLLEILPSTVGSSFRFQNGLMEITASNGNPVFQLTW